MLTKENIKDIYALSPMQEGLFFHSLLDKSSSAYLEQFSYRLQGPLQIAYVQQSLQELLRRYDVLRTVFIQKTTDRPIQVVLKERQLDLHYEDLSDEPQPQQYLQAYKQADTARTFALSRDVLMRVAVFRLSDQEHEFIWTFHHILLDGWCLAILNEEFFQLYYSLLEGRPHQLPAVKPYVDYIRWLEKRDQQEANAYWAHYLEGYCQTVAVPGRRRVDRPEGAYLAGQYVCQLRAEKQAQLARFPGQYNVTMSSVLQAVWALLLSRYNQSDDVVFGVVVSGRPAEVPGVESMVGLFVNSVPVRIRTEVGDTFLTFLQRVQQQAIASEPYHYHPLSSIQAVSEPRQGLIDHLLVYENFPTEMAGGAVDRPSESLRVTGVEVFEQIHYDFNIICSEDEVLRIKFSYNAAVYDEAIVEQLAGHFLWVLEQVLDEVNSPLASLEILPDSEKHGLLTRFVEGASIPYPVDQTIHGLFEARVAQQPEAVAVRYQEQELSYGELNERANSLANYLREVCGVGPGQVVGLLADRTGWMPVAILGILKSGAAYLPLDADCPGERAVYMLGESGARMVITGSDEGTGTLSVAGLVDSGLPVGCSVLSLSSVWSRVSEQDRSNPLVGVSGGDLCYIIYTSGSTGSPKGVMIEHRGPVNLALSMIDELGVTAADNILQFSSLTFDVSVCEILMALLSGATLTGIDLPTMLDGPRFLRYLTEKKVSIALLTPSFLSVFDMSQLSFLRVVLSAGEAMNVRQAVVGSQYFGSFNGYGPTECSVLATTYRVTSRDEGEGSIPIGRPIANTRVYVLDETGRLLPAGVPGEICLGGVGLARGYVGQPELTAAKFMDNPFRTGEKLYRTGDIGWWLPDGNLVFVGRKDNQVKVRGYRVELGEVGHVLKNHAQITEALVLCRPATETVELAGYYTAGTDLPAEQVRAYLLDRLPPYMVPTALVQLAAFPTNSSGKIDTKALLALSPAASSTAAYAPPRSAVEEKLADIWQRTLKTQQISIHDNYFDLGGDSIKVIKAYNLVQHEFPEAKLEVADLFKGYTIAVLSDIIEGKYAGLAQPQSELNSLEL